MFPFYFVISLFPHGNNIKMFATYQDVFFRDYSEYLDKHKNSNWLYVETMLYFLGKNKNLLDSILYVFYFFIFWLLLTGTIKKKKKNIKKLDKQLLQEKCCKNSVT